MGNCISAASNRSATFDYNVTIEVPVSCNAHVSEREGSGHFSISEEGRIAAAYKMRDGSSPESPRNHAKVADLERKLFKATCDSPQFDHKPRETLRNRFTKFNTVEGLGPIPRPPARVLNNPQYQASCERTGRAV
jgi:hypothetical protein